MRILQRARKTHRGDGGRLVNPRDHPVTTSWWTHFAKPEDRSNFMIEAAARSVERQRAEDVKQGQKNQLIRHIIAPHLHRPRNAKVKS